MSFKKHFSRSLAADPDRVHFAAHSHHLWPDVSFDAHVRAWEDGARLADRKWEKVFGEIVPSLERRIAKMIGLASPSLAFAPNTHDFVRRILSCLGPKPKILTTSSEFHSFTRQTARLEEEHSIDIVRVPSEPLDTLSDRIADKASKEAFDLVFVSHVLFDSSFVLDVDEITRAVRSRDTFIVIDGYHGFCAVPTNLAALEKRVFYMAGGYKYAMSGEGCCFLHAPPDYGPRPRDTGWFASFGTLTTTQSSVAYAEGSARFYGATFDPTALYRMNAVLELLEKESLDASRIRAHVRPLQERFAKESPLPSDDLVVPIHDDRRGQFLTFRTPEAGKIQKRLEAANIITDARGDRLRFGFGIYHDEEDIARGIERITRVLREREQPTRP